MACTAQPFPSGSLKKTNEPQGNSWTSLTSTPRPASSAGGLDVVDHELEPLDASPASWPDPIRFRCAIEQLDPGGVSWTLRISSLTWWS